jgi:hypothetical protein
MGQCIGTGCGGIILGAQPIIQRTLVYEDFFLDPDAMDPNNEKAHADAFKKGITPPKPSDLKVDPGAEASKGDPVNVHFDDRYAILYDISHKRTRKILRIGFQVSDKLGNVTDPYMVRTPNNKDFRGYRQVYLKENGPPYHVVVAP